MNYKNIANRLRKWANGDTCKDCPTKDDLAFCAADAILELLSKVKELEDKNKRLEQARENANAACAKWEGLYYELENRRHFVTEYCPHCDTESTLMWSVEEHGYEIYCPVCGKKIMLCSMCGHHNDCDWTEEAGCKMKKEEK